MYEWFYKLTYSSIDLGEGAQKFNIDTVTQTELMDLPESECNKVLRPIFHCAGGDSEITLRIFVAMVLMRIQELNDEDKGNRKIRDDYCFVAIDL